MLTDAAIKKIKPPPREQGKHDEYPDAHGLQLQVYHTGRMVWVYPYRFDRKQKSLTIGRYPDVKLASEQIQHIQNNLRLNMSALAELIDVSRPSLYKWLKGEPPHSQEVLSKISWLHNQASRIEALNLFRADILIKRPLFNGQSLFDFLKLGTVVEDDYLQTLQNIDQKEANVRASSGKGKPIRSIQDAIDEISTPIMRT